MSENLNGVLEYATRHAYASLVQGRKPLQTFRPPPQCVFFAIWYSFPVPTVSQETIEIFKRDVATNPDYSSFHLYHVIQLSFSTSLVFLIDLANSIL
jgi:hypothetical protein